MMYYDEATLVAEHRAFLHRTLNEYDAATVREDRIHIIIKLFHYFVSHQGVFLQLLHVLPFLSLTLLRKIQQFRVQHQEYIDRLEQLIETQSSEDELQRCCGIVDQLSVLQGYTTTVEAIIAHREQVG